MPSKLKRHYDKPCEHMLPQQGTGRRGCYLYFLPLNQDRETLPTSLINTVACTLHTVSATSFSLKLTQRSPLGMHLTWLTFPNPSHQCLTPSSCSGPAPLMTSILTSVLHLREKILKVHCRCTKGPGGVARMTSESGGSKRWEVSRGRDHKDGEID